MTLDVFSTMPVPKAVMRNALPAIAAMLMVLIYNLADTFFIGQTHDVILVAAVSLVTPVFLLFMAVGTIFGIGGTSVISRALGEGRAEYAKKVSAFCMWASVAVGISMSVSFLVFMDQLLAIMGASPKTWEPARTYLTIVAFCGPFVLVGACYSNVIRAEGQSSKAMMGMLIGNLLNIALDPVMILAFGWGIAGAAVATVIGNAAGALYYIVYFLRGSSMLSISPRDFTMKDKVCSSVLVIGVPASLGSLMMSVSQIIVNGLMAGYGDMALAGMGVAMKVTMMTGMVCIGLGQGVQPLLGYCVGAKSWTRFRSILKFSLGFAFLLSAVLTALCYLFADRIVHAFLTESSACDYAISFSRILLTTSALFGMFYVLTNTLQAMGAAVSSLIINISRQGLIYIPALFILNICLGATGLAVAQPVVDILSFALAIALYFSVSRKMMLRQPTAVIGMVDIQEALAE